MERISSLVIPVILLFSGFVMIRGKSSFDTFLKGAGDGIRTTFSLIPTLTALLCALSMFRKSGAEDVLCAAFSPVLTYLKIPSEVVGLAVTRPVSGSASTASFAALLEKCGPDSLPAVCAAILMGSSDTLIYVMGVYFSRTHVRHAGRAITIGALSAILCLFLSALLARLFFVSGA